MLEHPAEFCLILVIPPAYAKIAREKAIPEIPSNTLPFEAATYVHQLWKPGRKLHVALLEGELQVQQKVALYTKEWSKYRNIIFNFDDIPAAQVHIAFQSETSWSTLGTEALVEEYFPKGTPTMNFGWLTPSQPDYEYFSTVLHRFGHALVLIHEPQNPDESLKWNYDTVIEDLSGFPNYWNAKTIQSIVLAQYDETKTRYSYFDPTSIMLYSLPGTWTLNGRISQRNYTLSEIDKKFKQTFYLRGLLSNAQTHSAA